MDRANRILWCVVACASIAGPAFAEPLPIEDDCTAPVVDALTSSGAPAIVHGQGWALCGGPFAGAFEHSYPGDETYRDYVANLIADGEPGVRVLWIYGAYDFGDEAALYAALDEWSDLGQVDEYDALELVAGAPMDITSEDLAGVDVVVFDASANKTTQDRTAQLRHQPGLPTGRVRRWRSVHGRHVRPRGGLSARGDRMRRLRRLLGRDV